jgi:hypothetical protein
MRLGTVAAIAATVLVVSSCQSGPRDNVMRMWTDNYTIRVKSDPSPPRALEPTSFIVTVTDRKTGQPIQAGAGRIFATNEDSKSIANGFAPGAEPGTYKTNLMFVTAGAWAMGIQFKRDTLPATPLERTIDWTQDVSAAAEPGAH